MAQTRIHVPIAWRARMGLWLWRHGLAWPLCALLLAAAALLAWDATRAGPVVAAVVAPRLPTAAAAGPDDAAALAAFRAALVPADEATATVRRLVTLTQPELAWQRAEFAQSDDAAPGVARLQITVPVSGEYRAVRTALQRALLEMPQLSLDQVRLQRDPGPAAPLEARLRFSLWLRPAGVK
jgi:hypothetical protein